jgi:hypothetical protein
LPLRCGAFSVARAREMEVAAGDRLLVRANDPRSGVLNGEIVTVGAIEKGLIQATDGRRIDTWRFGEFSHGFAVTSHASQSKTVEHVVVAAERLTAKAAYVACSRGQISCVVHTPDKTALLERLPDGNRDAALDFLGSEHFLARQALDRTWAWAQSVGIQARTLPEAIRRIAARVLQRDRVESDARVSAEFQEWFKPNVAGHRLIKTPADKGPSMGL